MAKSHITIRHGHAVTHVHNRELAARWIQCLVVAVFDSHGGTRSNKEHAHLSTNPGVNDEPNKPDGLKPHGVKPGGVKPGGVKADGLKRGIAGQWDYVNTDQWDSGSSDQWDYGNTDQWDYGNTDQWDSGNSDWWHSKSYGGYKRWDSWHCSDQDNGEPAFLCNSSNSSSSTLPTRTAEAISKSSSRTPEGYLSQRLAVVEAALRVQDATGVSHIPQLEINPMSYGITPTARPALRRLRRRRNEALHAMAYTDEPDKDEPDFQSKPFEDDEDKLFAMSIPKDHSMEADMETSASEPNIVDSSIPSVPPSQDLAHHTVVGAEFTKGPGQVQKLPPGPQQPVVAPDPSALEDLVRKREALRARLNQARTKEDMISLTNQYADVVQLISDTADRLGIAVPEAPHSAAHRV